MTTISENQALERWDMLSPALRSALCSDTNTDFIWEKCRAEFIPEDKIPEVAKVAGYVLMGFISLEDVGKELQERLSVDPKVIAEIQDALTKRIFDPFHAELKSAYGPVSKLEPTTITIVPDTGPVVTVTPGARPAMAPLSEKGWSKLTAPAVTPTSTPANPVAPAVPSTPSTAKPTPATRSAVGAVGEFARLAAKPASPQNGPTPVIIQQTTPITTAPQKTDFHLARPQDAKISSTPIKPAPPVKPAVLEFGGAKQTSAPIHTAPKAASPVAPIAPTQTKGRDLTELTASAPAPIPPTIPAPPMPAPATPKPAPAPTPAPAPAKASPVPPPMPKAAAPAPIIKATPPIPTKPPVPAIPPKPIPAAAPAATIIPAPKSMTAQVPPKPPTPPIPPKPVAPRASTPSLPSKLFSSIVSFIKSPKVKKAVSSPVELKPPAASPIPPKPPTPPKIAAQLPKPPPPLKPPAPATPPVPQTPPAPPKPKKSA